MIMYIQTIRNKKNNNKKRKEGNMGNELNAMQKSS